MGNQCLRYSANENRHGDTPGTLDITTARLRETAKKARASLTALRMSHAQGQDLGRLGNLLTKLSQR